MNKKQHEYIISQLDKMQEELESVKDTAKRAELRGKYIELFIDLSTISSIQTETDDEEPPTETEPVAQEVEEEVDNVKNADEIFEDAEVVRTVIDEDGEEVDITDAFNALIKEGMDEDFSDSIGLFLTECDGLDLYMNKFNYMEHGIPRACAAQLAAILTEQQLQAYIIDFSGLELGTIENSTDFIDDANAEELFDFIRKDMEERQELMNLTIQSSKQATTWVQMNVRLCSWL